MKKNIYILGVGHNTAVYIDLCEACGYKILGLFHYNNELNGQIIYGYRVVGSNNDLFNKETLNGQCFALSMGDNQIRQRLFETICSKGGCVPTLIHPTATVSKFSKLGNGVVVHINSIIHPDVVVGNNSVLSYNSAVTHCSTIGNHCYLSEGVAIGAYTKVEDNVFMGMGSITISGKVEVIGEGAYIGAGSLITKSVESKSIMAGSPARLIRMINN